MNSTITAESNRQAFADMSDEILIRKYQQTGERQLFSILYKRYTHLVFGACLKYLRNPEDSRDMAMSIFEKILRNPPSDKILAFKSWLHKYVQNECFYHIRTRSFRGASFRKFEEMETRDAATANNEGESRLVEKESAPPMKLGEAIRKLPKVQKECIRLFYLKEKSYKQIVEKTGYTEAQVKSYLQNGKRRLKVLMTGEEEDG
ncbi:MAG: RNA polymerase sigma factor (sigma-70 family) [Polaribacter sp.]|jgi:RNA polymerase sigma factor (sigma-70 family)